MRLLGLPVLLLGVTLATGCFTEPPSGTSGGSPGDSSSGSNEDTTTDASTSSGMLGESTFGGTTFYGTSSGTTLDTFGTSPSTGTTGAPGGPLLLFPLACTEDAEWTSGPTTLTCVNAPPPAGGGAYIQVHNTYDGSPERLPRVIEVQPNSLTKVPVDGTITIDTSGFANPVFQSEVACVADPGCAINYDVTPDLDEQGFPGMGGLVVAGGKPSLVTFELPSQTGLTIRLNVNSAIMAEGSRFLWIDPRVVEGF